MTKAEFAVLVKTMKAVFSDPKFIADDEAMKVWYALLNDIPYEIGSKAVQSYMSTEKFPPTPSDVRKKAEEIVRPAEQEMSELEAWSLVFFAICNSAYNSEREFAKLPELAQRAVGNPQTLKEWAAMSTDTVNSVEQSHFIRNYRAALICKKQEQILPGSLNRWIEEHRQEMINAKVEKLEDKKEVDDGPSEKQSEFEQQSFTDREKDIENLKNHWKL